MTKKVSVASVFSYMVVGGDENRLMHYLSSRDRDRFDQVVINCMTPGPASEERFGNMVDRLRRLDVEVIDLGVPAHHIANKPSSPIKARLADARAFAEVVRRLTRLFRQRRVELVDARVAMGTILSTLAGRAAGVRAIVSTNYDLIRLSGPVWGPIGQATYAMVDALICDSQRALDMQRDWMIRPPPGFVVENGINRPVVERTREDVSAELGVPDDALLVAQVARLRRFKGQDRLLWAARHVLAEVPRAFFVVCGFPQGDPSYAAELERIVADEGIGDRARILGYTGSIGDIWNRVDLHVHPTSLDSLPIAITEAMAFGIPSVTTNVGGITGMVINGESGVIVPEEDPEALVRAIVRLLQDGDRRRRMGEVALGRYQARHRPEVMARQLEDIFEQVLARPRLRR